MTEQGLERYRHTRINDGLVPSNAAQQLVLLFSNDIDRVIGGPDWELRKKRILANPEMVNATPRDSEALLSMAKRNFIVHPDLRARERAAVAVRCVEMSVLLDLCHESMSNGDLAATLDRMTNEHHIDAQCAVVRMTRRCKLRIIVDALLDAKASGQRAPATPQCFTEKGLFLTNWTVGLDGGSMGLVTLHKDRVVERFIQQGEFLLDSFANEANFTALRRRISGWGPGESYGFLIYLAKRGDIQLLEFPERHTWETWNDLYIIST